MEDEIHAGGELQRMQDDIPAGVAALSICEALLLALNDRNVLPESEIVGILEDAANAHKNATGSEAEVCIHAAVATLINRIIDGGNSVRRG